MSWMDSWSRPAKHQATPAPFYLIPGAESTPYCRSCGRAIRARKSEASKSASAPVVYCSVRCRNSKPGRLDREIERVFVRYLSGEESLPAHKRPERAKGDRRVVVPCEVVEAHVFGHGLPRGGGPKGKDAAAPGEPADEEPPRARDSGVDFDVDAGFDEAAAVPDYDVIARMAVRSGTRIRPAQGVSEVNGSVGGEKGRAERAGETEAMKERRIQGQREVREREMVRAAARRGVVFGFAVEGDERAKCEAVMQGKVVEPSYAKGDWGIRWRERE